MGKMLRVTKTCSGTGTGWQEFAVPEIGLGGLLYGVCARLDATTAALTTAKIYLGDDDFDAQPDEGLLSYESAATGFTGHATTNDLRETLSAPLPYYSRTGMYIGIKPSVAAGAWILYVTLFVELED